MQCWNSRFGECVIVCISSGKMAAIREDEEKLVWAAIARGVKGAQGWKGGRIEVRGNMVMGQERCGGDGWKKKFFLSCI